MTTIKVAACQLTEHFGDINATVEKIDQLCLLAESQGARLICFPECYLQGYRVESAFVQEQALSTESDRFKLLRQQLSHLKLTIVLGFIEVQTSKFFNSAAVIQQGELIGVYRKQTLMRSEQKVFSPGANQGLYEVDGLRFSIAICKDLNLPECYQNPKNENARLIVAPCNNMLSADNARVWEHKHNEIRQAHCKNTNIALLCADVTGERDGKLALGPTALINDQGDVVRQLPLGQEGFFSTLLCESSK